MSGRRNEERLLVVIPAFNEQGAIRQVVGSIKQVVPRADVLVIDDGSRDSTAAEARAGGALVVRHPFNLGIGGAVQTALKFARQMEYDLVVRTDGDGQHTPQDIPLLLTAVQTGQADVAIGTRFLQGNLQMHIPLLRRLGIQVFAREVSLLTGQRATDTTSGFMCLNRHAIHVLADHLPQDYPEVEGRIILHKAGLTTLELPARMRERVAGVSSINQWRSLYYAFKVTLAVLLTALKDLPRFPKEIGHARRAATYRHGLQPKLAAGDGLLDP